MSDGSSTVHLTPSGSTEASGGGAAVSAEYRFQTSIVEADPGNGNFRMDNATPASVTELFISSITDAGFDFDTILGLISAGDQIYIQQDNDASKFILFDVTANVDNTGWFSIAGTTNASGTIFDNNGKCHILILFGGSGPFGDVFKVGTPVDEEFAVWTGDGTLASTPDITSDGVTMQLTPLIVQVTQNFRSRGIQDSATARRLLVFNNTTQWGAADDDEYSFARVLSTGSMGAAGGAGKTDGGNFLMRGPTHFLFPGDTQFRSGLGIWQAWDESAGEYTMSSGIGDPKTLALTIDANQDAAFVGNVDVGTEALFTERADHSFTPIATRGILWVRDDAPNVLIYTDDAGTDFVLNGAGGGDVFKVGTPVDNQVGVWTGDGTIEGTTGLTYDGSDLGITGNIVLTGLVDGVDVGVDVPLNTAKITNATHTGQVTGATALALDVTAITDQPASGAIAAADTIITNDGGVLSEATFTQMTTFFDANLGFGDVFKVGTPVDNQIGVWTGDGTIEGDPSLTWDGSELNVSGDLRITETVPSVIWNETNAPVDNKIWLWGADVGQFYLQLFNDAESAAAKVFTIDRTLNVADLFTFFGDARFEEDVAVVGDLIQTERAAAAASVAGLGQFWVRDDVPNDAMFTNDIGTDFILAKTVGVPVDNQIGVWTGNGTIEGDANFLWDDSAGATDALQITAPVGLAGGFLVDIDSNQSTKTQAVTRIIQNHFSASADALLIQQNSNNSGAVIFEATHTATSSAAWAARIRTAGVHSGAVLRLHHDNPASTGHGLTIKVDGPGDAINIELGDIVTTAGMQLDTDLVFTEQADHTFTPVATRGILWVRDDAPNNLIYTDDAGTDFVLNGVGGGDVTKVGTPVDNQVGVWTGDGTIEGTTGLTYDGATFNVTGDITLTGTVDGIDIATDVAANTAKVTNATHTGQVTGATALALDITAITAQPASGALVGADTIIVNDGGTLSEATMDQVATFVGGGTKRYIQVSGAGAAQVITGTPITMDLTTSDITTGAGDFTLAADAVTIINAGTYRISAQCTVEDTDTGGSARTTVELAVEVNSSPVAGSVTRDYHRETEDSTGTVNFFVTVSANDVIRCQLDRLGAATNIQTVPTLCKLNIELIS